MNDLGVCVRLQLIHPGSFSGKTFGFPSKCFVNFVQTMVLQKLCSRARLCNADCWEESFSWNLLPVGFFSNAREHLFRPFLADNPFRSLLCWRCTLAIGQHTQKYDPFCVNAENELGYVTKRLLFHWQPICRYTCQMPTLTNFQPEQNRCAVETTRRVKGGGGLYWTTTAGWLSRTVWSLDALPTQRNYIFCTTLLQNMFTKIRTIHTWNQESYLRLCLSRLRSLSLCLSFSLYLSRSLSASLSRSDSRLCLCLSLRLSLWWAGLLLLDLSSRRPSARCCSTK